jgi:hypothetical protein
MVLLAVIASRVLEDVQRKRLAAENETVTDLRAHCVALGERDGKIGAEAETPAAGNDGRIVLDRLRPGTAKAGRPLCPTKLCD